MSSCSSSSITARNPIACDSCTNARAQVRIEGPELEGMTHDQLLGRLQQCAAVVPAHVLPIPGEKRIVSLHFITEKDAATFFFVHSPEHRAEPICHGHLANVVATPALLSDAIVPVACTCTLGELDVSVELPA